MSLLNLIVAIRKGFSEWRLSEQAYGNLLALNDHLLADIGLHRALPEEKAMTFDAPAVRFATDYGFATPPGRKSHE